MILRTKFAMIVGESDQRESHRAEIGVALPLFSCAPRRRAKDVFAP
jgi:hypothetical protein